MILVNSFILGISAVAGAGPVFWLTFSRGARYGFSHGLVTALGASLGDGLLAFLGLLGILSVFQTSQNFFILLDLVGGVMLIALGSKMLEGSVATIKSIEFSPRSHLQALVRSFVLTVANPLGIVYFIVMGTKVFPKDGAALALPMMLLSSGAVALGSLCALGIVAYGASRAAVSVNTYYLQKVSFVAGICLIAFGLYFLSDIVALFIKSL